MIEWTDIVASSRPSTRWITASVAGPSRRCSTLALRVLQRALLRCVARFVQRLDQARDRRLGRVVLHDDDAVAQLDVDLADTVELGESGADVADAGRAGHAL